LGDFGTRFRECEREGGELSCGGSRRLRRGLRVECGLDCRKNRRRNRVVFLKLRLRTYKKRENQLTGR